MFLKQQERLLINIFELVGGACVDSTGTSFGLMAKVYRDIFPLVHQELDIWKQNQNRFITVN